MNDQVAPPPDGTEIMGEPSPEVPARKILALDPKYNLRAGGAMPSIVPRDMNEAYRFAQALHLSNMQPKELDTPEKILVVILHGLELGMKPMQAVQRIAVINNRPTLWGDGALSLVRASGLCEWIDEQMAGEGDSRVARCEVQRRGDPRPTKRSFSVEDAIGAGLWQAGKPMIKKWRKGRNGGQAFQEDCPNDSPWFRFPARMLQMRARGFALRDAFPDVLGGMYLREEIEEETAEPIDVTPAIPTPPVPPPLPSVVVSAGRAAQPYQTPQKIAEGPNRAERGEFLDKAGVAIPIGALNDFDAFQNALDTCPTLAALTAMYAALTRNISVPDDIAEAKHRYDEVAAKFEVEA